MSKEKKNNTPNDFMSLFPGLTLPKPPMVDALEKEWGKSREETEKKAKGFKADFKSFWEKGIDVQKSTIDGTKDQYDQFFDYMTGMLDDFAEFLPDEMPLMPSWAQSPKSFRKSMKEWEEMVNNYFIEQMNTWTGFFIESQEKACERIPVAPEGAEEAEEAAEAEADKEKPAAAAKEAKPAKASAAKTTKTAKAAEPAAAKTKTATKAEPAKTATKTRAQAKPKTATKAEPAKTATKAKAAAPAKATAKAEPAKDAAAAKTAAKTEPAKDSAPAKDEK